MASYNAFMADSEAERKKWQCVVSDKDEEIARLRNLNEGN